MSDHYEILVIAVPAAEITACAKRVLGHLHKRDVIAGTAHRQGKKVVAIMRGHLEGWLRRGGLRGKDLVRQLDAADAAQLARRWWSASEGAREVVNRARGVMLGSDQPSYGVELVRGRKIHTDINVLTAACCPACGATTPDLTWWEPPLAVALAAFQASSTAPLTCPRCHAARPLATWRFDPPAIAGELALRFGNMGKLKASFVRELAKVAQYPIGRAYELV